MKRIILFVLTIFLLTGCSEKTVYPQIQGDIQTIPPSNMTFSFNKEVLLEKVDKKARNVFNDILAKEQKISNMQTNIILNNIYKTNGVK